MKMKSSPLMITPAAVASVTIFILDLVAQTSRQSIASVDNLTRLDDKSKRQKITRLNRELCTSTEEGTSHKCLPHPRLNSA